MPPRGERWCKLALTGNMSTGGISIDRTFEAHPDNVDIAEEAARVVGLDIAGIDFLCPDITQPVRETGGAICEVNAAPGFRMHSAPDHRRSAVRGETGGGPDVPARRPSRIPIVAVTGTNGKTTTSRMIAHIFKGMGRKVGMTSTDGIVIDDRLVIKSDASGPRSARMVLQNPRVDFAVFEVARGGILREGLGYAQRRRGGAQRRAATTSGCAASTPSSSWPQVKQVIVEAVPKNGAAVLNADDPLVAGMRGPARGRWSGSRSPDNEMIDTAGAAARPSSWKGRARRADGDPRRAAADAVGLHASAAGDLRGQGDVQRAERDGRGRRGLRRGSTPARHPAWTRSFTPSFFQAPGRMNLIEVRA